MVNRVARIRGFLQALQTTWSIFGLAVLAILLTEAGFRLVFAIKDHLAPAQSPDPRVVEAGYGGAIWLAQHYRELEALEDRWEPYVYFRQKPLSGQTITIDESGRRRTWHALPDPDARTGSRVFRIILLGGSSLWGFGARDDHTIPSLIARKLHERRIRVEVKNLAEIGYVNTQEVVALVRELQSGYRPDLVIFYDGVNDTTSALLEGEAGVTTNERNRRAEFNLRLSPGRLAATMVGRLIEGSASYRFAQAIGRRLVGMRGSSSGPPAADRQRVISADVVGRYRTNLEIVDRLGRGFGFDALYFWQPVVFDKPSLTLYEHGEAEKLPWGRELFSAVYEAIRNSSELRAHPMFHDLSREFRHSEELVFIDYCHTTESGYERIAQAMLGPVEAALRARSSLPNRPAP
jgi:lysophospholipase L1-like esterase